MSQPKGQTMKLTKQTSQQVNCSYNKVHCDNINNYARNFVAGRTNTLNMNENQSAQGESVPVFFFFFLLECRRTESLSRGMRCQGCEIAKHQLGKGKKWERVHGHSF